MKTKTIKLTSKTNHNIPTGEPFTVYDYVRENPEVNKNTAYQRLQTLKKDGILIDSGNAASTGKRGRTSVTYTYVAPVNEETDVIVASIGDSDVEVPVITHVDPLPDTTISVIETV